jgi:hypothetical protein
MSDDEVWRDIPEFPNYQASSEGRVRNLKRNCVLTGTVTKKGYRQYSLRGVGGRRVAYGHRLVAAAFLGPSPAPPCNLINHLDTNQLNNRPTNLEYTTPSGNARHAAAHGLLKPVRLLGEKNPQAKLSEASVRAIRALRQQGVSVAALGKQFGVTERAAHLVVTGQVWRHVSVE